MVEPQILNRKGALKAENIPTEVLELLNSGKIETVNLTEWLAVNHIQLIKTNFSELGISNSVIEKVLGEIQKQKKSSTMNTIKVVGEMLKNLNGDQTAKVIEDAFDNLHEQAQEHVINYVNE